MKTLISKLSHSIASCFVVLVSASYAHADDTEIFFGTSSATDTLPNVLFILDNSGSMDNYVTAETNYDNTIDYIQKRTDEGRSPISDTYIYLSKADSGTFSFVGAIYTSQNHCQTMRERMADAGFYSAKKAASYSNGRWRSIFSNSGGSNVDGNLVECKDDRKIHGKNGTTNKKYATNGSQWTGTKNNEISWENIKKYKYYSANYLNWYYYYKTVKTKKRIDAMKDVLDSLIRSTSGMNIGLMSFNTNNSGKQGGRVTTPIGYIEDNRAAFLTDMNSLYPATWTPLSETLYEAKRYYEGGNIFLGSQSVSASKNPSNSSKYLSPIVSDCQPNKIVLLTDGEPTYDAYNPGYNYDSSKDSASRSAIQSGLGENCTANCLDEISRYMNEKDLSTTYDGLQNVQTYTIGFDIDDPLLSMTAEGPTEAQVLAGAEDHNGGGGQYFTASNTIELEGALTHIFSAFEATNTTFVTPGVAVNTFNRLNHRDELYFSVFRPENFPQWGGNLKRYKLGSDGIVYDYAGDPAIDEDTGYFREVTDDDAGAWSWWSSTPDADNVALGGAAENLPDEDSDRNIYTYTGTSKDLSSDDNAVSYANKANITKTMLGAASATDAEHEQLINWVRGMDVLNEDGDADGDITDSRKFMMDPLHSPPVVVIYGADDDKGTNPDTTIFFGDNQGFLHAINGKSGVSGGYPLGEGQEYFSFIPDELLENQKSLFDNSQASAHPYGLDGAIAAWTNDENGNNQLDDSGDFVYIYTGMRRGGRNYYALDVTDRISPKFLWEIKGGAGGTTGFEELGQTWSKPVKTKVKMNGDTKEVLIFAGGYDTNQDTVTTRTADSMGRAIYIVNAETGALIWSASHDDFSDMQYSIPSNVKAIDVNSDGIADQFYVGDMGGQLWRFDIDNENSKNSLDVYGGVIADLAGSTKADNRRFYHAPDISVLLDNGKRSLAIAIGSGWQAHPLNTDVTDRFFLLKNADVLERPVDSSGEALYTKLTESDLYDATENHLGDVSSQNTEGQQAAAYREFNGYGAVAEKQGWYITFTRSGEKALATSLTVDSQIYFTTYEPKQNVSGCTVSAGIPRLFHIDLGTAKPVMNYDGVGKDTELTKPDREVQLQTTSLPTSPQRLRIDGKDQLCIGTECRSLDREETIVKTYWVEEE